mgnify:FL=1
MANVLVTGGAGFIGAHVAKELLEKGYLVTVLDDLSGGFVENVDKRATFVKGSITDRELINALFAEKKFDYVFHLAAYAAEGLSHFIKHFNYTNNVLGSINLINAAVNHDIKCFVFTSSIAVYGKNQVPMHEDMIPAPEDSYGIAKYTIEQELKASHEMFGLNYVIFRPHNVYGELQNIGDKYRNVIGIFMNQIMHGKDITVFGDGEQTRAFSYIGDVAPIIAKSIETPAAHGHVFNVGADIPYTVNQLVETVKKHMNAPNHPFIKLPPRNEVKHAHSDHAKARKVFGDAPATHLDAGVAKMAAWAKEVGARKSTSFDNIEVLKNLPPSWLAEVSGLTTPR